MNALPKTDIFAAAEARYCTDSAKPFPGETTPIAPMTEDSPWYAVRVTPMQERFVRDSLKEEGIEAYFPLHVSFPPKAKRKATRTRPLIPGYIFVCLTEERAIDILRATRGFREIMCWDGKPRRVPPRHLGALILAEAFHVYDETWVPPRPKGKRYHHRWEKDEIVHIDGVGPFRGFNGRVVRTDRKSRISLEVMLFGRASFVEVDSRDLRKLA